MFLSFTWKLYVNNLSPCSPRSLSLSLSPSLHRFLNEFSCKLPCIFCCLPAVLTVFVFSVQFVFFFLYCPYCTVQYTSCALYALQSTQLRQEPQWFEWFQQYCRYRMTLLYYCTILLYCCKVRTWTNSDSHILTALFSPNLHANEWYWTHKCWCLGCHMGCVAAVCMLVASLVAIGSLKQSREIVWT